MMVLDKHFLENQQMTCKNVKRKYWEKISLLLLWNGRQDSSYKSVFIQIYFNITWKFFILLFTVLSILFVLVILIYKI